MQIQSIIIIHFFRNLLFSQSVNCRYLHSGTKSSGLLRYCTSYVFIKCYLLEKNHSKYKINACCSKIRNWRQYVSERVYCVHYPVRIYYIASMLTFWYNTFDLSFLRFRLTWNSVSGEQQWLPKKYWSLCDDANKPLDLRAYSSALKHFISILFACVWIYKVTNPPVHVYNLIKQT